MSTPQPMAYHRPDTPGTLSQDDVETEVRMLERQREWVRNPEYIDEQNMKIMRRLGVNVIKMPCPCAWCTPIARPKTHHLEPLPRSSHRISFGAAEISVHPDFAAPNLVQVDALCSGRHQYGVRPLHSRDGRSDGIQSVRVVSTLPALFKSGSHT
jgi:hypothetical protein